MSERARLNLRIDADLKERLRLHAEAKGISIGQAWEEFVQAGLGNQSQEPDTDKKDLQTQLEHVDRQLSKLRSAKTEGDAHILRIAEILQNSYSDVGSEPRQLRVRVIKDFREGTAGWSEECDPKGEDELVQATNLAISLIELCQKRNELETKLGAALGMNLERQNTKEPTIPRRITHEMMRKDPRLQRVVAERYINALKHAIQEFDKEISEAVEDASESKRVNGLRFQKEEHEKSLKSAVAWFPDMHACQVKDISIH